MCCRHDERCILPGCPVEIGQCVNTGAPRHMLTFRRVQIRSVPDGLAKFVDELQTVVVVPLPHIKQLGNTLVMFGMGL